MAQTSPFPSADRTHIVEFAAGSPKLHTWRGSLTEMCQSLVEHCEIFKCPELNHMTRCPSQRADAPCDGPLAGIVAETAEQQADTGGQAAVPVTMLVKRVQGCLLCSEANGLAPNVSQSDCHPSRLHVLKLLLCVCSAFVARGYQT